MMMSPDFFISYRHTEEDTVNNLASGLSIAQNYLYKPLKKKGYAVYYAPKSSQIGEYPRHIERAVKECKVVLWVLSKDCFECRAHDGQNDWFFAEVLWAVKYQKEIFPIFSPDFKMPSDNYIREQFYKAFSILKKTGYFKKKEEFILNEAFKIFQGAIKGHKECVYIDVHFNIKKIVIPIKHAGIKIIRHKRYIVTFLRIIVIIASILLLSTVVKTIYDYFDSHKIWKAEEEAGNFDKVWDGKVNDGWNSVKGDGTAANPYQIEEAAQLAWLAYSSQNNSYENTYFLLKKNIVLNEYHVQGVRNDIAVFVENGEIWTISPNVHQWTPIGNEDYPFGGHFDGGGYIISGVYITSDENYQGLFGVCSEKSIIENVNILAATIQTKGIGVGSIAGKSSGLINKCNVNSVFVTGGGYVGGVAGIAHEIVNTYAQTWIMGYSHSHEAVNGEFVLSDNFRKCYGGVAGYCDYIINSMASAFMQNTYKVNGGLVGEVSSDVYNCLALGVYIEDAGYVDENDSAWLSGDVIGQYDGNAEKQVSDKKLYYISENNMECILEDNQLDVARQKFPYIDFKEAENAPANVKTWTYENHDYSVKTGKYNELSTQMLDLVSAAAMLNENIDYIEGITSVENVLKEHGIGGDNMELVKWVTGNGEGCFCDIKNAPWLETTDEFKRLIDLD